MKKRNVIVLGLFAVTALALTACQTPADNYFRLDGASANSDFNTLRTFSVYDCEANQMGEARVLVVPVEFTNYSADDLPLGREGTIAAYESLLFGDPSEDDSIMWESLASFYDKSSYGKMKITGEIVDWWDVGMTTKQFNPDDSNSNVQNLVAEINEYYRFGEGSKEINVNDFDANDDGYIDLTFLVYSCPQRTDGSEEVFWAYTTQFGQVNPDLSVASISRYIWVSHDFMFEGGFYDDNGNFHDWTAAQKADGTATLDAHTFIHEAGHGFGLADYYSYDYNGDSPIGGPDMMDNNVGDNNAYSKTLMGWISPYVVTGNSTITLNSFELTGDAVIVPIHALAQEEGFEEEFSILDEYLIIQFDTPDGLAVMDGEHQYAGNYPLFYNEPGVRIFHVDSRIGIFANDGTFQQYASEPYLGDAYVDAYYIDFAHDNTLSRTVNGYRLIQLITPKNGGTANLSTVGSNPNEFLWKEGQVLNNWTMHTRDISEGSFGEYSHTLGYRISIDSIDAEAKTCTISFTVVE